MTEFWKWIAGATVVVIMTVTGTFFAMAGGHGERIAKVETAIIYLSEIVKANQAWHAIHGHPDGHDHEEIEEE